MSLIFIRSGAYFAEKIKSSNRPRASAVLFEGKCVNFLLFKGVPSIIACF